MSGDSDALSHHPAPQAEQLSSAMTAFLLFTGPLAWFAQFCIGVTLTSWPCFPVDERLATPLDGYRWTGPAALILLLAFALLSFAAGLASWRVFRRVRDEGEDEGDGGGLMEIGHGRTRFVALWGMILGAGFGLAILLTLVAFALVPRCAG